MSLHTFCLKKITAGETPIVPVNLGGQENLVDQAQKKLEPFEVPETRQLMEAKPTAIPGTWEEEDGGIIKTSKEAPVSELPKQSQVVNHLAPQYTASIAKLKKVLAQSLSMQDQDQIMRKQEQATKGVIAQRVFPILDFFGEQVQHLTHEQLKQEIPGFIQRIKTNILGKGN